jgi:ribosomal protein L11 methylase PrmA
VFELLIKVDVAPGDSDRETSALSQLKRRLVQMGIDDYAESVEWVGESLDAGDAFEPMTKDALSMTLSVFGEELARLEWLRTELFKHPWSSNIQAELRDLGHDGWLSTWQAEEQSQGVGGFYLQLVEEGDAEPSCEKGFHSIQLRRGTAAFGSGQHCTTRAVLRAMTDLSAVKAIRTCLDVGTGNGVLAIAAARLGATKVIATELDALSLEVARWNSARNQVGIEFRATGEVPPGAFDLVCCNILLPELLRLIPELALKLAEGGVLLTAGYHRADAEAVESRCRASGLSLQRTVADHEWLCSQFTRGEASSSAVR